MRKSTIINLGIVFLSFGIAFYFYPLMPGTLASHWNSQGEVNGYMGKFWGLFLLPFMALGMTLLFWAIPKMDPRRNKDEQFAKYLGIFSNGLMIFFFYLFLMTIFWNMGYRFNFSQFMIPALALLYFGCGIFIEKIKLNYFAGIRTPWTLDSEENWAKTHKLGGKLFKLAGLVALVGLLMPRQSFFFAVTPIILSALFLFIYSYLIYRRAQKQ